MVNTELCSAAGTDFYKKMHLPGIAVSPVQLQPSKYAGFPVSVSS